MVPHTREPNIISILIINIKQQGYFMCGITGIYHQDPNFPLDTGILKKMTNILFHRGPDEVGYYTGEGAALGIRRLSIIDIHGGNQPIHNENSTLYVILNGEIFNYIELMKFLKSRGHCFYTKSDTEVIVHLYEEYGDNFVNYINGQFSIAIWNSISRELLIARDRLGIRPLYYSKLPDGLFLFGSEMKALFCHPSVYPEIDYKGLEQLYTIWVTVPPRTVFKNITELLPGSILKVNKNGIHLKRYWKISFPQKSDYENQPLSYYTEKLRELVYDSVTLRLRADVPVASYLSGGLDSSIISALVKKYHNNSLKTFSVLFKDASYDERLYQQLMVDSIKTEHSSIEIDNRLIGENFSDVIWHAEYPMLRTAPAPLFELSKLVRKNNIKVVLTGEGADEIFCGYNIFKENLIRRFWARIPDSKMRPLLLLKLYPYIHQNQKGSQFWQLFFKRDLESTESPLYSHLIRWSNASRIKRFISDNIKSRFNEKEHVFGELQNFLDPDIHNWVPLCQAQYLELSLFMSGYLLSSQGDRMMMGNSVEGRFPFLDHRIVEFASTIPPRYKLNGLNEKYILKQAFGDLIPETISKRPKQPYRAPVSKCFLPQYGFHSSRLLSEDALQRSGLFDVNSVSMLISKITGIKTDISASDDMAMAAIVSTQLLYHNFISEITDNKSYTCKSMPHESDI